MVKIGEAIENFKGIDQNGNTIELSDYKGHKLIIFFYPKASTPGCTAEACSLRDEYSVLKEKGYELLGVSADSVSKQMNFATKNNLPFPLIADEDKKIIKQFGVWGEKKFMGRTFDGILRKTFIVNESQILTNIIEKVQTKSHAQQIMQVIENESE
ncbi:thioredoxin-dependent thiol peroxidase [Capnocytophaga cynodegmi]|uniref:thioredoxin-dependent thiol peroxidase n=1 Tax=Capnocytophaga cynodegmi TaxID=28189 RepID=UPI00036D8E82|nr:thioredoxin-dependent thiol peroxidase [Capnocytophaga cynodegmi]CEN39451.1 putative peroxiredoxin bcp [Capnocytophaga cynodegmi]